jgi:hypothetical protein
LCVAFCLLALLIPSWAFACGGRDAAEQMSHARNLGLLLGVVAVAVTAAALYVRRRGSQKRQFFAVCVLAVTNPGWWFPVNYGDCGEMRVSLSIAVLVYCSYVAVLGLVKHNGAVEKFDWPLPTHPLEQPSGWPLPS